MAKLTNNVKKWYMKKYPTDEMGIDIPESLSFMDVYMTMINHGSVYEILGNAADSVIRERIFQGLCQCLKVPYNYVYNLWLSNNVG